MASRDNSEGNFFGSTNQTTYRSLALNEFGYIEVYSLTADVDILYLWLDTPVYRRPPADECVKVTKGIYGPIIAPIGFTRFPANFNQHKRRYVKIDYIIVDGRRYETLEDGILRWRLHDMRSGDLGYIRRSDIDIPYEDLPHARRRKDTEVFQEEDEPDLLQVKRAGAFFHIFIASPQGNPGEKSWVRLLVD